MDRVDHLLIRLAEECAEVTQRVSKALVFGLAEKQEGQSLTNEERLKGEVIDVFALLYMLVDEGLDVMPILLNECDTATITAKRARVEKYLEYSRRQGRLESPASIDYRFLGCSHCGMLGPGDRHRANCCLAGEPASLHNHPVGKR